MNGKRDRSKEREANRIRMAVRLADPEYRAMVNARRAKRDAERKAADTTIRQRLTAASLRHYRKRAGDPEFWEVRKRYLKEWRARRRDEEAFEMYMERMLREQESACQ